MKRAEHVVVIMMDDLAYGDLACHGNRIVQTPNLDALHARSSRLTGYLSGPMCTPARAALMTGRHPQRTRAIDTFCGRSMLDPGERTIARLMGAAGFTCGGFGKWHLGDAYPMRPNDMGFHRTLTHGSGGIGQFGDHPANNQREGQAYTDPMLSQDGHAVTKAGYCTDVFTDAAMDFLTDVTAADGRAFCYLATNAPHTPLEVPDRWADPYRAAGVNETHARLYGMVANIDHNVGRLLECLDQLGIADDTLVVYTSDHGPCPSSRDFSGPNPVRWNAGLRGEKGSLYQGALKVPSFWAWPGVVHSGVDVAGVCGPIDVLPTVAAATGVALPDEPVVDGVDLLPALTGEATLPTRDLVMQWHRGNAQQRHRGVAVVRRPWKLVRPDTGAADPALVPAELYDLDVDPGETTDLAADHAALVDDLVAVYDAWYDDVSTTRPDNWAPPRIVIGHPEADPVQLSRQDWRLADGTADMGELAGWASTTEGRWLVESASSELSATVVLDRFEWSSPAFHAEVVLDVDGRQWRRPWVLQVSTYDFAGLDLALGAHEVQAYAEGGVGRRSAVLVEVRRA